MITIHHEKETDFSKNGYGAIDDYVMSQEVTWEMNGQFYAYLEYPAFLDKSAYLVNKNVLRVPVPFMEDQLFRIYRVRKVLGFIQVEARHIFYDLMDNLIEDTNIVGKTGSQAIQQLLGATQYEHRFIGLSDISTSNNARMVRYNPVEALLDDSKANTFVSRWGGEIVRDNFLIRMARQMGTDRGVRIQHRKDLTAYIATIDESTVVTRIMPVGFDGLKLPELYIDSPLLDPDNPKIGVIRYENVKAAIGEYADDNGAVPLEEAYELLREHARAEFNTNHLDEPEMTVTVNFVTLHNTKEYAGFAQLQEIHQGDVVRVSVPEEGFEITSRLVAFTSDPLQQNHYTSTTLGNHVYEFTSSTNSVSTLRNEVEVLRESVVEVRQSANGKNQSFWGEADPNTLNLNAILGDTYFRSVGEEDVIYQYVEVDGERYWKEIINTANTSEVKKEVERVAEEAEKLADDITEAQKSADDAKRDASLALTASEALEIITQETASQLSDTRGLLATVESNASEAWAKADSALSQAGQAITDAYTAQTTAQSAISQAQSALSKANSVEETTNSLVIDVDNLAGEVSLKADSSTVNTLSGTVSSQGTTLTQQAGLIASKANQSEVDTVKGTVSTHTTTLTQHAKDISARLTQSQVDSLVDGKGLAEVTYVDSQIGATAESFGVELTKVESKIPTSTGGNNLLSKGNTNFHTQADQVAEWDLLDTFEDDEVVTVSFRARTGNAASNYSFYYGGGSIFLGTISSGGRWEYQTKHLTFKWKNKGSAGQNPLFNRLILFNHPLGNKTAMQIDWIVLTRGDLGVSQYVPALSEMVMDNDFTVFKNTYQSTVDSINTELSKTAKKVDLNGMVTESYLATNQYTTQGQINTQLVNYLKTTDLNNKLKETVAYQNIKETTDRYTRVIGSTDAESRAKIAQIAMTDSLFQTTVLDSVQPGGRNLLQNTAKFSENTPPIHTNHDDFLQVVGREIRVGRVDRESTIVFRLTRDIQYGEKITISYRMLPWSSTQSIARFNMGYSTGSLWTNPTGGTGKEYKVEMTITAGEGVTEANYTPNREFWMRIKYPFGIVEGSLMIESGNLASNWTPAPEDMATSKQLSDIKQTADSIQALVGTTNESVARAVMTSSLWETEVSKVIDGELKQEYETVTSQVANVTISNDAYFGVSASGYNYYDFDLEADMPSGREINIKFFLNVSNNRGQRFVLDYISSTGNAENILSMNLTRGQNSVTTSFVASKDYSSNGAKLRLKMYDYSNYVVYFEAWHEVEHEVPIIGEDTGAIASKISQLYDMINLSVLGKEGALSRIAMGEEGIQIDGKLLHITAKTYIDDAVIKSAMIESLDAGKITTGELNASLVKVINLDANSIAGNEASFIRALFTGTRSILQITGNRLSVVNNDGFASTIFESDGMSFYGKGKKVASLQYQAYAGGSTSASSNFLDLKLERDTQLNLLKKNSKTGLDEQFIVINGSNGDIHTRATIRPSANNDGIQLGGGSIGNTPVVFIHSTNGGGIAIGNQDFFYKVAGGSWKRMS